MAKIDDQLVAIEKDFLNPEIRSGTTWVPDEQMEALQVRRKKAGEAHHRLWYLSVGETGQQLVTFWGHKFSDALKKALIWRGLPTASKGKKAPPKAA